MPFIGTPKTSSENNFSLDMQKYLISLAISGQDWQRAVTYLLETIARVDGIMELEDELIPLLEQLAICHTALGDTSAADRARERVAELRQQHANN
ncbi:hypothetical protein NLG97_g1588 [Lecanicillium saksenae]|uniref:Uncharacterized protein n=1 Tax=Lecanicillium saksenae TaxID=468837 RepID=A0ACC1R4M4_9HYPO|nr:hypothetical protein NLG97_g1588 [Lecanicillium saksenae]